MSKNNKVNIHQRAVNWGIAVTRGYLEKRVTCDDIQDALDNDQEAQANRQHLNHCYDNPCHLMRQIVNKFIYPPPRCSPAELRRELERHHRRDKLVEWSLLQPVRTKRIAYIGTAVAHT